jgi:hypothetical protein
MWILLFILTSCSGMFSNSQNELKSPCVSGLNGICERVDINAKWLKKFKA